MSYALIISSPNVIPFVREISGTTTADAIKSMQEIQDENFAESIMMLVDYENRKVLRVALTEEGFQISDNAERYIGVNTAPQDVVNQGVTE